MTPCYLLLEAPEGIMCERTIRYVLSPCTKIRKGLCQEHQVRLVKSRKLMRNTNNVPRSRLLQAEVCVRPETGSGSSATEAPSRGGCSSLGAHILDTMRCPPWLVEVGSDGRQLGNQPFYGGLASKKGPY